MEGPLDEPVRVRMSGICKRYGAIQTLDNVDLTLRRGEVLGLVGDNGAGKSTLLKILSGAQAPDGGGIVFAGEAVSFAAPYEAQRLGIVTIYQEFNLIPSLTVGENILIGREPGRAGLVDWGAMHRTAKTALDRIGLAIDPRRLVRDLSVAEQQMVEIARALSMDSRLIVMDEPTASLSASEAERLFAIIADLTASGVAILYVSHRLDEILRLCHRVTVFRDGRSVAEIGQDALSRAVLVEAIVGGETRPAETARGRAVGRDAVLRVSGLARHPKVREVSFGLHRGEVLGIGGLVGAGRTELARAVFGNPRLLVLDDQTPISTKPAKRRSRLPSSN